MTCIAITKTACCGREPYITDYPEFIIYCINCYDGAPDAGEQNIVSGRTLEEAEEAWDLLQEEWNDYREEW